MNCANFFEVTNRFNGILLDAYGVFWGGNDYGMLPGSKNAMADLVARGKIVGVLSNSTQLAAKEIEKLERHGVFQGRHFHFLLTSGEIARSIFLHNELPFRTEHKTYWLFGGVHPRFSSPSAIFEGSGYQQVQDIRQADFIYVSIPHRNGDDQTDPEQFRSEIEQLGCDLPMVCANPDQFAHEGKPPIAVVRQGSIAKIYESFGGKVFYIGKPHNKAYAVALEQFQRHRTIERHEILMIGDTPETDIRGARSFGMSSALVLKTGMMADREHQQFAPEEMPEFFIERFAHGI